MSLRALLLLLGIAGAAHAASPKDFAVQWPVLGDCAAATGTVAPARAAVGTRPLLACDGAFELALDASVYRQARDPGLADVAAFDADGAPLAFGPMPPAYRAPPGEWRAAAWFALPTPTAADTAASPSDAPASPDLDLHVHRAADGSLQLDATLGHAASAPVRDLLVDVRGGTRQVEAVAFDLAMDAPDFSAAVAVDASDDLQAWRSLVPSATIAQLRQQGHALVRRRITFAPASARYLRVRVLDGGAAIPVRGLQILLHQDGATGAGGQRATLRADFVERQGRAFVYRLPARIPADRLAIRLADDNAIASFAIGAREAGQPDFAPVGTLDAFRLRGAGLLLDNEALEIAANRAPEWRLVSSVDLARPPTLEFSYQPEAWLLLTHGKPPFRVVAGSRSARRAELPLDMLVGEVRRRYGPAWRPAPAALGPMAASGGAAALRGWDASTRRTWLLWGVLLLAAVAIIAMVLRLLRQPDP